MVNKFKIHLNENCMTIEKSTKLKLNGLIYAQAGLILIFIVTAIVFYGSQLVINDQNSKFQEKQEKFNKEIQQKVFQVSLNSGVYANKEFVTRGIKHEADERKDADRELKELIKENQSEILDLLKRR